MPSSTVHPKLQPLLPIVEEWKRMHSRYCEDRPEDAAFWCTEATNTALLAAAAWRTGGMAIVEYPDKRETEGGPCNGRVDLWMQTGPVGSPEYVIEAKQMPWLATTRLRIQPLPADVDAWLAAAVAAARTCTRHGREVGIGVLFYAPKIEAVPLLKQVDSAVRSVQADLCEFVDVSHKTIQWDGYVFPGVYLLARLVPE